MFAFADPTELWLQPDLAASHWRPAYTNAWNAYLNQVCLDTVLAWVRAEHAANAAAQTEAAIWEFVNGSAISLGAERGAGRGATRSDKRLAIIPTEAMDDAELAVPQEWVDIPNWAADYYLAVEVQLESDPYIRIWGYASHQQLKAGQYDPEDRSYVLEAAQLTQDWNALWVTLELCPDAPTRATLAPLPELPLAQIENLIQRLGRAAFPRLAIPFELWGAVLQVPAHCQQLYQTRIQDAALNPVNPVHLGQWFQQQVTTGWQQLEALLSPAQLALNLRSGQTPDANSETAQAKRLELAGQTVALVVQLNREADGRFAVLIQLHPTGEQLTLVPNLQLKLLAETETSQSVLQSVQSGEQDSYIQLRRFRCPEGTEFQVELEQSGEQVVERFIV
jgi:hypothetical protein